MIRYLCQLVNVSRSGYYQWLAAMEHRATREEMEAFDVERIRHHFERLRTKAGALTIKMHLEHEDHIIMNHKKIRRLMKKHQLIASVRRANPYKKMLKATQEHKTVPNLLNRVFQQGEPQKVFLTDITYLRYNDTQWGYLSCVKDGATREILAYDLSSSLGATLATRTLERLEERLEGNIHPEAIIHSDQGMHYTHPGFRMMVSRMGLKQSMSRRGNCWDNATMESFFGHMKDELAYKDCRSIEELRERVHEYIAYYNTRRYQWTLKKMTPDQYRSHLLSA